MAFPQSPLDLRADLLLSGTWTAAAGYLYQRDGMQPPVTAERGRKDESPQANPSSASFEVNNRDGRWSPKNPAGAWYGQLARNTPVRLSIPAQANYLRLEADNQDRAYVNHVTALDITGSIEMRVQLRLSDWQGAILAAKWDLGGCWYWALNPDGTLTFGWTDSGTAFHSVTSPVPVPFSRATMALRVTMDATTGTVTFSTAPAIGGTFTALGTAASGTGGAATSVFVSAASALVVGYSFNSQFFTPAVGGMHGQVDEYRLYNGIGGTVVADGVFSGLAEGTTTWTDSAGRTWLLGGGAEVSGRDYRYHGELSALPPKWDGTGSDQSVTVTAGGPLRRIGQGQSPVQSPMRRALAAQSGTLAPVAYWPCEDAAGATAFGSAIGGTLLNFDGSPQLATDSSFLASAPLPALNGSRWYGQVPAYTSNGAIALRWLQKAGTAPGSTTPLMRLVTTGTATEVTLSYVSGGGVSIAGNNSGGSVFTSGVIGAPGGGSYAGVALWMSLELTVSAGTVSVALNMMSPGGVQFGVSPAATYSGVIGNVTQVRVNPNGALPDTVIGHASVQSAVSSLYALQKPLNAWTGEAAGVRYARLAGENGLNARVIGPAATTALMGPQSVATLSALLQECEDADRGQQFEPRACLGVGYRTLASMLNQAPRVTLDYAAAVLGGVQGGGAPELEPTYDDQKTRNDWTVTRGSAGGGGQGLTYQYQLDDGSAMSTGQIGTYDDTATVNVEADGQVPDVAGWLVRLGTVDEARWPAIPVNLARSAIQSGGLYYPLLGIDIGDYIQVANLPGVITSDPVRQLVLGLKESPGGFHHTVEFNCAPESAYEVAVLDDLVYGRADTDGCQLRIAATSGATTLAVASAGLPWTADPADCPFDIAAAGERITVTAVGSGPSGSATSPGAFHQIANAALPPGTWLIGWTVTLSGTVGAPELNNFDLATTPDNTSRAQSVNAAAAGTYPQSPALVTIDGSTSTGVTIRSRGNAATAGAVYGAVFTSPQALTVTRAVNGVSKAQAAGADVRLWFPPILSLI